jgi:hypothetical protein
MPVTAKLSRAFYDRLGDEIANELVSWFNAVDATYRQDLRELNEQNFVRFDAKLGQRLAELDARWDGRWKELDAKWDGRRNELDAKWSIRWNALDAKIDRVAAETHETLERGLKEQTRRLMLAWASLLIPIIGLWMRG